MPNRTQLNILSSGQETAIRAAIANLPVAEIVRVYFPEPDGTINYSWRPLLNDPVFASGVTTWLGGRPLVPAFSSEGEVEHHVLPRSNAFGDDTVQFRFGNENQTIEGLLYKHRLGVKVEVFKYIPAINTAISV